MSSRDAVLKELEDIQSKLTSARKAAEAPQASERDKADLKLIEQEYLAVRRKAYREAWEATEVKTPPDGEQGLDKKLDEALMASFPGSDPVSFVEPAPVKEQDRLLPGVQLANQQPAQDAGGGKKQDECQPARRETRRRTDRL
jgi:hypothetical protein